MNKPLVKYVASRIDGCTEVAARTFFEKQDGSDLSLFQRIGLRYLMLDALIDFNSNTTPLAHAFFVNSLIEDGWTAKSANQFLAQPDWKSRMNTTWLLIGDEERAAAVALDYETFQNFWPSLDFIAERSATM
ncbi:hypothetical protein [Pseudomonas tolaasii]|uniref:hypothetical protein n=1 Tax=Pseudomonas tolaasii TaxID=29442 RepID=UPI0027325B73|nr:hypothetical protein [Pseudomonas tolaasii]WLH54627.1 hypothetical protein PSH62_13700 [Pseudomonas tolaasii]